MAETPPAAGKSEPGPSDAPITVGPIRFFFEEFLVNIFGGLVPGLVFLLGVWTALPLGVRALYQAASAGQSGAPHTTVSSADSLLQFVETLGHVSATVWFFLFVGLIVVIYVFGLVFITRGPKEADQASYSNLEKREMLSLCLALSAPDKSKEPVVAKFHESLDFQEVKTNIQASWLGRWALKTRRSTVHRLVLWISRRTRSEARHALHSFMRDNYAAESKERCEFPYDHLADYLKKRRLDHLVVLVPWRVYEETMPKHGPSDPKRVDAGAAGADGPKTVACAEYRQTPRSRVYVNILKLRLMQLHPGRCKEMVRHEADVRLSSGVWHAAGALRFVAAAGVAAFFVADVMRNNLAPWSDWLTRGHWRAFLAAYFWGLAASAAVLLLALYFRRRIERLFHNQRMRELVCVLDTAFTAFRSNPELLVPPFDGVVEWVAEREKRGANRRSSERTECRRDVIDGVVLANISDDHKGACFEAEVGRLRVEEGQVVLTEPTGRRGRRVGSARWLQRIPPALGASTVARMRVGVAAESAQILEEILSEQARPPQVG